MHVQRFHTSDDQIYRAIDSFSLCALTQVPDMEALLAELARLRAAHAPLRLLCTLDDVRQCLYTSGHARQDDRLWLDQEEGESDAEHETRQLAHVLAQLNDAAHRLDWPQLAGSLACGPDEVRALLLANREPDALLDDEAVFVQALPVPADHQLIAGLPNGYFSGDWDVFQNHALSCHLQQAHGYHLFGMGAAWLGFERAAPPSAEQAAALVDDLRTVYAGSDEALKAHPDWTALQAVLPTRRTLLLGYAEDMADSLAPDGVD